MDKSIKENHIKKLRYSPLNKTFSTLASNLQNNSSLIEKSFTQKANSKIKK